MLPRWLPLLALSAGVACSVYSENLLSGDASSLDSGANPDGGTSGASGGLAANGGSGGSGSGSGPNGGTSSGSGGVAPDSGVGDGGCTGSADELDCCPADDAKTDPGVCGCGTPDGDGDGDGVFDCVDGCPADGEKTEPGSCGCGLVDSVCAELAQALAHRYSFDGEGPEATDAKGGAHGSFVNVTPADGAVALAGTTTDQHVDLPDGIVSSLGDATFEIWATWNGGAVWQRPFDFGNQASTSSRTYLFFTASTPSPGYPRAAFTLAGPSAETFVDADTPLLTGNLQNHVAVVIDDTNDMMHLYLQGEFENSTSFTHSLSDLNDVNNWLGRSQFNADPDYGGTLYEFRIYAAALSAPQIRTSYEAGPDAAFLTP